MRSENKRFEYFEEVRRHGYVRKFLHIPTPLDISSVKVADVQPSDEVILRPMMPSDVDPRAGMWQHAVVCHTCESNNASVVLFGDDEVDKHFEIHGAITRAERYRQR